MMMLSVTLQIMKSHCLIFAVLVPKFLQSLAMFALGCLSHPVIACKPFQHQGSHFLFCFNPFFRVFFFAIIILLIVLKLHKIKSFSFQSK